MDVIDELISPVQYDRRYKYEKQQINYDVAKLLITTDLTIDEIAEILDISNIQVRRKQAYICSMVGVDRGRLGLKTAYIELLEEKIEEVM